MDLEKKEENLKKWGTWGFAIVGLGLAGAFIMKALAGLVALVAFLVTGLLVVNLAPAFGRMLSVWRIKAIKAVAQRNPEEVQRAFLNQLREHQRAGRRDLEMMTTEVANYESEVANYIREFGASDAQDQIDYLEAKKEALHQMAEGLDALGQQIAQAEQEVRKWQAKNRMSKTSGRLADRMSKARTMSADDQLAMEESFRAMQNNINSSMVKMRSAVDASKQGVKPLHIPKATLGTVASKGFTRSAGPQVPDTSSETRSIPSSGLDGNIRIPATVVAEIVDSPSDKSTRH